MLEVAREKALYGDKKKYVLLVILVCPLLVVLCLVRGYD